MKNNYRKGVGIMLLNKDNKAFVGKRIDTQNNYWQMPQGGIDQGETTEEAAKRELWEETGVKNATILYETLKWHHYNLPKDIVPNLWGGRYIGQKQKWFLMRINGNENAINLNATDAEFMDWQWLEVEKLTSLIVPFKKQLYENVIAEFTPILNKNTT